MAAERPLCSRNTSPKSAPRGSLGQASTRARNGPTGIGQAQNDGVAGFVKQTPGAIGYVELTFILMNKGMQYGQVQNAAGNVYHRQRSKRSLPRP